MKCFICLGNGNKTCIDLYCSHRFHLNCIKTWAKESETCPLCRSFICRKCLKKTCYCKMIEKQKGICKSIAQVILGFVLYPIFNVILIKVAVSIIEITHSY